MRKQQRYLGYEHQENEELDKIANLERWEEVKNVLSLSKQPKDVDRVIESEAANTHLIVQTPLKLEIVSKRMQSEILVPC